MSNPGLQRVMRHIRRLADRRSDLSLKRERGEQQSSDQDLLERIIDSNDESAFSALMHRHGPMVRGVCQRLLDQDADRDDAFQATFLVLFHKARSIRKRRSLGSWLYGVAYRIALKARSQGKQKKSPGGPRCVSARSVADTNPNADPARQAAWRELCAILDQELNRLSERYRSPLVLCYLSGQTQEEAAAHLGCSLRTLKRRLEQAKHIMRLRLSRRGLTLSSSLLIAGLSQQEATALPFGFTLATLKEASLALTRKTTSATIPANAFSLSQTALKNLALGKLKILMACVVFAGLAVASGVAVVGTLGAPSTSERHAERAYYMAQAKIENPRQQDVSPAVSPKPKEDNPARTDPYGDPLPEEAIARLGTVRFRHGSLINSLVFTPDGKQLISQSDDVVRIWDAATGRQLSHLITEPNGAINSLFVTRDGKSVITMERGPHGNLIRFRNRSDLKVVREFNVGSLETPRLSPDSKLLAGLEQNHKTVEIWDLAEGRRLRSWKADEGYTWAYEFSADGKTLVTGGQDKIIRVWEVATGRLRREFTGHPNMVGKLALSPDGAMLATLGETQGEWYYPWDNFIRIWDLATGKETCRLTMPIHKRFGDRSLGFNTLAFDPDGKTLVTAGQDDMLRFWNPRTGTERRSISLGSRTYMGNAATAALAFAIDGKTLAVGTNAIRLIDTASGREVSTFGGHRAGIYATATTDGQTVFTAGREGNVVIWDLATGKERARLDGGDQTITAIATLASGRRLLTSGLDTALFMVIRLWDLTTNQELRHIRTVSWDPRDASLLALSPDERTLAVPGKDNRVALIDMETGKELARFEPHDAPASGAAFHPDGHMLIVWCRNHTAHVWDLKTARKLRQFEFADVPPSGNEITHMFTPLPPSGKGGRTGYAYAAALSPDDRYIAYGSLWNYLAIHEVLTGKTVRLIDKLEPDGVGTLAFSPDGRMLAWSGWQQPRIHLLEMATGKERHHFDGHKGRVTSLTFSSDGRMLISGGEDTTAMVWAVTGQLSRKQGPLDSKEN